MGLSCGVLAFLMMGLAPNGHIFLLAIPLWAMKGFADPALTALMSRHVLGSEQGQLQGATSSLLGIAGLIGPTLYTEAYAFFASPREGWNVPGAPFLLSAMLLLAAIAAVATRSRAPIEIGAKT